MVFYLDTFNDGRNGVQFVINSIGGRTDGQASNDGAYNGDYNMIWDVATGRFDGGWIIETAVPFKSLRYQPGADQVWGINVVRTNRWKNELSFLNPVPKERGQAGVHFSSVAGLLQGIVAPSGSANLDSKPYAISNATGQTAPGRGMRNDLTADVGVDAKYGLTQNLTADLTYNTDFAQVEADQQQVNLTRFSLFFPEKRDFFLENQGMFAFGGASNQASAGQRADPLLQPPHRPRARSGGADSRRRAADGSRGPIHGRPDQHPDRGRRDHRRSADQLLGRALEAGHPAAQQRRTADDRAHAAGVGLQDNVAYGVDGTFGFFQSLSINTYWARTEDHLRTTPSGRGDRASYRGQLDYNGDRYGLQLEQLAVGDAFNPGVGYLRRPDIRRSFGLARFSPRPQRNSVIRKYSWTGSINYVENGAGLLETREREA